MKLLDLTLESAAENIALDESLLEEAEASQGPWEVLRLWEASQPAVIVGRSSRVAEEVNLDSCRQRGIPVLRRCSGGAGVLIGPGCLMYAVVLSYQLRPALRLMDETHRFVLDQIARALNPLVAGGVTRKGISDLAHGNRKFSGNSVRCKRTHLLYHGTLLYDFPLPLIGQCLLCPPRQPEYRAGRAHDQFVSNLPLAAENVRSCLAAAWQPQELLAPWPCDATRALVRDRYAQQAWNYRR